MTKQAVVGIVEKETPDGLIKEVQEKVTEVEIPSNANLCKVTYKLGMTINIGNYESVRCDVGVEIPCADDQVDEAYTLIQEWVDDKLAEQVKMVKASFGVKA